MPKELFKTVNINGKKFVLKERVRKTSDIVRGGKRIHVKMEQPNYNKTGLALCGILGSDQSIDEFILKYKLQKASANFKKETAQ